MLQKPHPPRPRWAAGGPATPKYWSCRLTVIASDLSRLRPALGRNVLHLDENSQNTGGRVDFPALMPKEIVPWFILPEGCRTRGRGDWALTFQVAG